MADRIHVGTRKGLFELARRKGAWEVVDAQFLGGNGLRRADSGDDRGVLVEGDGEVQRPRGLISSVRRHAHAAEIGRQ